jgi:hypothetical protein
MLNGGYTRKLSTELQRREKIAEVREAIIKYFEQNSWYLTSYATFEEKFEVKEEIPGVKSERFGVKVMVHDDGPCITFYRFQKKPESPLKLDYRIDIDIGDVPTKKDLVDKVFGEVLALHRLLKEIKL